jgi:23S rRNA (cytidine1920-2'-O)/16S rRNA (cytidine1409-2'-O)-methyltransferase
MRTRLDAELVRRGLARSRENAQDLIDRGLVLVSGIPASKPATQVDAQVSISLTSNEDDYVSRGGHKLAGALDVLEIQVVDSRVLDAGASTGGFTDVLLRRGAREVIAVDVGYGQLSWNLQQDERVKIFDRTNVRDLTVELIAGEVDLVVADLSFISLKTVLPALTSVAKPEADLLLMVKPQFEVGRDRLGAGGVVRERELRALAVREVADRALEFGFGCQGVVASPLPGPSGNVEYFLWLKRSAPPIREESLQEAITKGPQ